jgi:putative heme-binding domain-containing protein
MPHRLALLGCAAVLLCAADDGALLARLLDPRRPMEEREAAVKALARTRDGSLAILKLADENKLPAELKATASFALAESPEDEIRKLGAQRLPLPKSRDGSVLPPLSRLLAMKGDARAGGRVYRDPKGPNCIACHQIGEEGKMVGPPLTTISNKLSRQQLFEAILTPSAAILMSYENWVIRTKDGDVKTGIKVEDTDDHVTLKDTNGEFIDIPAARIADRKQLALSMMPENITTTMTVQDLVDVVEYLVDQK